MSLAINREAITERLFGGNATVANQYAPSYRAGAPEMPALEYNPEKAKALLAYLALPPGKSRSREEIMALLWSDRGEAQARAEGHFVHVFVDRVTQRPTPIPQAMRAALEKLVV